MLLQDVAQPLFVGRGGPGFGLAFAEVKLVAQRGDDHAHLLLIGSFGQGLLLGFVALIQQSAHHFGGVKVALLEALNDARLALEEIVRGVQNQRQLAVIVLSQV